MICPHCNKHIHFQVSTKPAVFPKSGLGATSSGEIYIVSLGYCPNRECNKPIITLSDAAMKEPSSKNFQFEGIDTDSITNEAIIYPLIINQPTAPMPIDGMPDDIKESYIEARAVVDASPRSALALLRRCTEKLARYLEAEGKNLDLKIDSLAKRGYSKQTIKALDLLREVGNHAVHASQTNAINYETAITLFKAFNFVVDETIVEQNKFDALFDSMPEEMKQKNISRFNKKEEGE